MTTANPFSAKVRNWLVVGEARYELAQVGPVECILRNAVSLPPSDAVIEVEVDGEVFRHYVTLPEGATMASRVVKAV